LNGQNRAALYLYHKLLKLYPVSYRHDYENEMIDTMRIMLSDATTTNAKLSLLWRACKDYITSLTQQNIVAFEAAALKTPEYVRRSSKFSTSLVMPFFVICSYNLLNQYILHHATAYGWEAKTWCIYCIFLPLVAAFILIFAGTRCLFENFKTRRNITCEWLLLGIPLSLLVTLALM
jgi:hypothetical protein